MNKKGQTTIEYMLIMGAVAMFVTTFMVLFHQKLAQRFFWLVGSLLG